MKKNYTFKVKLNEEMAKKLSYVCAKEGISIQNMLVQLSRQKVQYFERVKGSVPKQEMQDADLSEFEIEEC